MKKTESVKLDKETEEFYQKILKGIIWWFEEWSPDEKDDFVSCNKIINDWGWQEKSILVGNILREYVIFSGRKKGEIFESKMEQLESPGFHVYYPPLDYPLNKCIDIRGRKNCPILWISLYIKMLSSDFSSKGAPPHEFQDYLWALYLYYIITPWMCEKISRTALLRMEVAAHSILFWAGQLSALIYKHETRETDRMIEVNKNKILRSEAHIKIIEDTFDKLNKNKEFRRHSKDRKAERVKEEAGESLSIGKKQTLNILEKTGRVPKNIRKNRNT